MIDRKKFIPDYNNLVLAAKNKKPARLPLYEHIVSGRIMEAVMQKSMSEGFVGDPAADLIQHYKNVNEFYKYMGYDAICYECCIGGALPGAGSLGGHKPGEITTMEDYKKYDWESVPDKYFAVYSRYLEAMREAIPEGMKLVGGVGNGVFECVQELVGYMDLCLMKSDDPELYGMMFDSIGDLMYKIWDRFLDLFDDMYCVYRFGDDLGYKISPMLSPEDIKAHVVPQYKKVVELIKRKTGKPFVLHSCGNIFSVMDDIISEAKIDGKHSNEDVIAPFSEWVARYGDRIALFGGIDTDALCDISGVDIIAYTKSVVEPLLDKGGIAIGSGNSITDYISVDRYMKMNTVVREMRGE